MTLGEYVLLGIVLAVLVIGAVWDIFFSDHRP